MHIWSIVYLMMPWWLKPTKISVKNIADTFCDTYMQKLDNTITYSMIGILAVVTKFPVVTIMSALI